MQILPDVFLVSGPPWNIHQNLYIVRLGDEHVMIDFGDLAGNCVDQVRANCAQWGIPFDRIRYLFLTHAHSDHASHAAILQRLGTQVVANRDCAEAIASGDDRCAMWAYGEFTGPFEPCTVDIIAKDGDTFEVGASTIRCLAAPGHANSCVVWEIELRGKRLWFVGDTIHTGKEPATVELGWGGAPDHDHAVYRETLRRLCHLPCDYLFCGHGPVCLTEGRRMMELAYTHLMTSR